MRRLDEEKESGTGIERDMYMRGATLESRHDAATNHTGGTEAFHDRARSPSERSHSELIGRVGKR